MLSYNACKIKSRMEKNEWKQPSESQWGNPRILSSGEWGWKFDNFMKIPVVRGLRGRLGWQGRAVARSENLGGHIVLGGDNVPPLVEIELTDLKKSGAARAPPAPPLATGLQGIKKMNEFSPFLKLKSLLHYACTYFHFKSSYFHTIQLSLQRL